MNLYDTLLAKALSGSGGGGGGEIESGVWTPTESNLKRGEVAFANNHTTAPSVIIMARVTDDPAYTAANNYMTTFVYIDFYKLFGHGVIYEAKGQLAYATNEVIRWNSGSPQIARHDIVHNSDETEDTDATYPRYFATETNFYPAYNGTSSFYFVRNAEYSWIAIWV